MAEHTFSDRLKLRRAAAGLTQRQLADLSGVKQPLIAAIERGTRAPSDATRAALERALRVRRGHQRFTQARGCNRVRMQRLHQRHMVEFVPAGILLPFTRPAHRRERSLRGLSMPAHAAAGHARYGCRLCRQHLTEHPRLLFAKRTELVVVGGAERRLPMPHQVDRAHALAAPRAIRRRQRQCR